MRAPSAGFKTKLAADKASLCWLVTLYFTSATVRYAFWQADITFNSNTYTANAGRLEAVQQSTDGRAPTTTIHIQNLDRTMRTLLETEEVRNVTVLLEIVDLDDLATTTSVLNDTYKIDAYEYDSNQAYLTISSSDVVRGIQVPRRAAQIYFCPFTYKSDECGYVGSIAACDYTYNGKNGCVAHFGATHAKRYGGFIGAPQRDLTVF